MVDEKLSFESHVNGQVSKASAISNKILRNFSFKTPEQYISLFNLYVAPILLYCTEIFNPPINSHLSVMLESPFKRFTARAFQKCGVSYTSYSDRLLQVEQKPFYYRRLKYDLLQTFKLQSGLSHLPENPLSFSSLPRDRLRLIIRDRKILSDTNGYFTRVVRKWNTISKDIAAFKNVDQFKTYLDCIDVSVLYPNVPLSLQ